MSDPLDELTAAYRRAHDRGVDRAAETRARLLRSARRRRASQRWMGAAAIVVALTASNSITWAWSTGTLARVWHAMVGDAVARHDAPAPSERPARRVADAPVERAEQTPRGAIASPALDAGGSRPDESAPIASAARTRPAEPERASPRPPRAERVPPAAEPIAASTARSGADEPTQDALARELSALDEEVRSATEAAELRAFQTAHRLHFQEANPSGALSAWDAYLTHYPHGRFVPEARFNRAICLIRLRRDAEARQALEPFARGAMNGLRQREATQLLDAMDEGRLRRGD